MAYLTLRFRLIKGNRSSSYPFGVVVVVSFWFLSQQQNPGNNVSSKIEVVSIRVNVTSD
jgi:hypothetical protein